jgi:hypothetical protein
MKEAFGKDGARRLRGAWLMLAACTLTAIALIAGTQQYLAKERRDAANGGRRLQEARARLDNIRREQENFAQSAETYRSLQARGVMQGERRLDLVELMNALRGRHQIASVDYEIAPQRPLALGGDRTFPGVDILSSRVRLRVRALHEGDLLDFIDALSAFPQGFHPVDRCNVRRLETPATEPLHPHVEAECTLEWITMKEKRGA